MSRVQQQAWRYQWNLCINAGGGLVTAKDSLGAGVSSVTDPMILELGGRALRFWLQRI